MEKQVIAVVASGWVFVGTHTDSTPDGYALKDAAVIRRWGTTRGLGELALKGVQKETVLDPVGLVEIERTSLICTITVQVPGGIAIP